MLHRPFPRLYGTTCHTTVALIAITICAVAFASAAVAAPRRFNEWASIHHAKRGFAIAYPTEVFAPVAGDSDDGRILASRDGKAKLLVGAFENEARFSLQAYRDYLLTESYPDAQLDYERTNARWFVISGIRGDTMFYERVTFTCGGQLVNSWVMLYPVVERALYDRVVEAVARTYTAGSGASGHCD